MLFAEAMTLHCLSLLVTGSMDVSFWYSPVPIILLSRCDMWHQASGITQPRAAREAHLLVTCLGQDGGGGQHLHIPVRTHRTNKLAGAGSIPGNGADNGMGREHALCTTGTP